MNYFRVSINDINVSQRYVLYISFVYRNHIRNRILFGTISVLSIPSVAMTQLCCDLH